MLLATLTHNFRGWKNVPIFQQFCFNFFGKDKVFHGLLWYDIENTYFCHSTTYFDIQLSHLFDFLKQKKPAQDWWDYDGFGKYKARYHQYPTNKVLRDVQRRRVFAQHAEERNRVNCLFRNDILPKELQELARHKITYEVPRDSAITRPNRRWLVWFAENSLLACHTDLVKFKQGSSFF